MTAALKSNCKIIIQEILEQEKVQNKSIQSLAQAKSEDS
jgi:hypothetical protein